MSSDIEDTIAEAFEQEANAKGVFCAYGCGRLIGVGDNCRVWVRNGEAEMVICEDCTKRRDDGRLA